VRKYLPALVTIVVMIVVILGLFLLTRKPSGGPGAAPPRREPAASPDTILILSPHNEDILNEFKTAFEKWHLEKYHAPCTVQWEDHGGTNAIVRFIRSEFQKFPGGIGADILWGGGAPSFSILSENGCLQPAELPENLLAAIPETTTAGVPLYDPQHRWFGTALSSFGIIFNRKRLAANRLPQPATWADLGKPEYFGEIAAADPRESGSAYAMIDIILQAHGWEKGFEILTRMAGNVRKFETGANDAVEDVCRRDAAAGLAIDLYAAGAIKQYGPDDVGFVLPAGLTPITPDPIAILKGPPHPRLAARFLEFVLSEPGQKLWILKPGTPGGPLKSDLFRIPVIPQIFRRYTAQSTAKYPAALLDTKFRVDPSLHAARKAALKDLYGALFIAPAAELKAAWKVVIARGLKPDDIKTLCTPPVSEKDIIRLSANQWSDSVERNRRIAAWARHARTRYNALAK